MPKLQFSGLYKSAKEIPPLQLMDYYIKGDQQERREAGNELLRRLDAYEAATQKDWIMEDEYRDKFLTLRRGIYNNFVARNAPVKEVDLTLDDLRELIRDVGSEYYKRNMDQRIDL